MVGGRQGAKTITRAKDGVSEEVEDVAEEIGDQPSEKPRASCALTTERQKLARSDQHDFTTNLAFQLMSIPIDINLNLRKILI